MDPIFKIRDANIEDLDSVFKFVCHLEENSFDQKLFEERFKLNIGKPDILYLVAVNEEDEAIGFISCHGQSLLRSDGKVCEIQEMYVSKGYRGKGIEKALFIQLEENVVKTGCSRLEVSAEADRLDTKRFYIKMGLKSSLAKYFKDI
jgi:(aminoalkyl)phosphonate N-acetyltransferase